MDSKTDDSSRVSSLGDWNSLLVGGFIGALIGALIVGLVARMANPLIDSGLSDTRLIQQLEQARMILTAWDVLALPVLGLIVLGTHEIGHVLGGLSQGMRFLMLIVGPFGWHATTAGTRFQWNTNLGLMGGLAATLPTQFGDSLRRQLLVMIAGGAALQPLARDIGNGAGNPLRSALGGVLHVRRRHFVRDLSGDADAATHEWLHERWHAVYGCPEGGPCEP